MAIERERLKVMLVSVSQRANQLITDLLPTDQFSPAITVSGSDEAKRVVIDYPIDIVIINTPLADDFGMQLAIDLSQKETTVVLLLVKAEQYEQISSKAESYGILAIAKPLDRKTFLQTIKLLFATRIKLKKLEQRAEILQTKMEEIRLINRAKLILIDQLKMSEAEAHRYIEKSAMDRCLKRSEIAENIIKTYENKY